MMANIITLLFKEAYNAFPPFEGKPTDDNLQLIQETLLPLLMVIPFDLLGGIHSLMGILTDAVRYVADHGNAMFVCPSRLPLYNSTITNNATTIVGVCAKAAHQSQLC
jgi:hypothetical protein